METRRIRARRRRSLELGRPLVLEAISAIERLSLLHATSWVGNRERQEDAGSGQSALRDSAAVSDSRAARTEQPISDSNPWETGRSRRDQAPKRQCGESTLQQATEQIGRMPRRALHHYEALVARRRAALTTLRCQSCPPHEGRRSGHDALFEYPIGALFPFPASPV